MRNCRSTQRSSGSLSPYFYAGRLLLFGVIAGRIIGPTLAQEILRIVDGRFGSMLAAPYHIDDLDGDGVTDVLVHGTNSFGLGQGTYFVHSGATGEMIWGPYYPSSQSAGITCGFGGAAVLGDFDGDGTTDIAIACGTGGSYGGHVVVLSGVNGHEITRITNPLPPISGRYAESVGAVGDVNGDGLADLIFGREGGRFDVHLGPIGAFAFAVFGPAYSYGGKGIGDITGDGKCDFVIGWRNSGVASVHSGADGALLTSFCMQHSGVNLCGGQMGLTPVAMGDINGDGVPDFALGNPDVGFLPVASSGYVTMYSGFDFSTIHQKWGRIWGGVAPNEGFGRFVGGGTDINGDGVNDLVASSDWFGFGARFFTVLSGRTGQVLFRLRSEIYGGTYPIGLDGVGCNSLGDLDGDGCAEWAVCDPEYAAAGLLAGRMLILKGSPGDVESICAGAPHSLGHAAGLRFEGPPTEGTRELWIEVHDGVPDAIAQVVFGPEHAATAFGDGFLCIDPVYRFRYASPVRLDTSGFASIHADWGRPAIGAGPTAWTAGSTWVVQATFRDAGGAAGYNATEALRVMFNR